MHLSSALTALLFLSVATPAYASFSDVPSNHSNADAIIYVQAQGVVEGYSDGTFRPDAPINRAEFVKILIEAQYIGSNGPGPAECLQDAYVFPDVPRSLWYAPYACVALNMGRVEGYPDGYFHGDRSINFVEAAKILAIEYGLDLEPLEGRAWYAPHVIALEEQYAIPTSITRFDQPITRGEMAEMIYRLKVGITNKPSRTYDDFGQGGNQWTSFSSAYFTLSFSVPSGFEVTDNPNTIEISKGPLQSYAIGSSSAFSTIVRYDQYGSRDDEIALTRRLLKNQKESMVTVDGEEFFMIEGDDYGRYEGDSAGRIVRIFFPKSMLEIQERPGNEDQDFDPIAIGKQILSTFRFSK